MYAYEIQPGQIIRHTVRDLAGHASVQTFRCVDQGRTYVNVQTGLELLLGGLVEVEVVENAIEERQEVCRACGERRPVSQLTRHQESYYDWDDPNPDRQGSVSLTRIVWTCRDSGTCRTHRRIAGLAMMEQPDTTYQRGIGQGWGEMD